MPKRERRFYPTHDATDLTDAQWVTSAPLVTAASPKVRRLTDVDRRMDKGERFSSDTGVRERAI
ncbi:hypothetical protein [Roseiflexus sp. RS-1]|jgi:putative transposase|uniref:hypothetical protein n=1 Tax=Roseiflexus sp. (strain RS-1) TaxID=357808 RepID=UPI0002F71A28|nr:hypothetical protein [Roseiflexus sp. RS-1]